MAEAKKKEEETTTSVPGYDKMTPAIFATMTMEQKQKLAEEVGSFHTMHIRAMFIAWASSPGSKIVLAHAGGVYESPIDALKPCMNGASQVLPFMDTYVPFIQFVGIAMKKFMEESKTERNLRLLIFLDEIVITADIDTNGELGLHRKFNAVGVVPSQIDAYKADPKKVREELRAFAKKQVVNKFS